MKEDKPPSALCGWGVCVGWVWWFVFLVAYVKATWEFKRCWLPMSKSHGNSNAAGCLCEIYMGIQTLLVAHVKTTWESKRCWLPMSKSHGNPKAARCPCENYMGIQTLLVAHVKTTWESKGRSLPISNSHGNPTISSALQMVFIFKVQLRFRHGLFKISILKSICRFLSFSIHVTML